MEIQEGYFWIQEFGVWKIGQFDGAVWWTCGCDTPLDPQRQTVVVGPAVRAERKQLHASQTFNGTT